MEIPGNRLSVETRVRLYKFYMESEKDWLGGAYSRGGGLIFISMSRVGAYSRWVGLSKII
mgnify:CR=1 FL=1